MIGLGKGLNDFLNKVRKAGTLYRIELSEADKQRAEELVSRGLLYARDYRPEGRGYRVAAVMPLRGGL